MADEHIDRMLRYYSERAEEYETIYGFEDPARRAELDKIESLVKSEFAEKRVLEVACGSGYWTEALSRTADSVTALDASEQMLAVASRKRYDRADVEFVSGDAYDLDSVAGDFNAALAGFWLSHVPQSNRELFLNSLKRKLKPGSVVLLFDNNLVAGMGGDVVTLPGSEDSFKKRTLENGAEYIIIKNYFTVDGLRDLLSRYGENIEIEMGHWYWSAHYRTHS